MENDWKLGSDKKFLIWLHSRLMNVHGDSPNAKHMERLRDIAFATSDLVSSPPICGANFLDQFDLCLFKKG